MANFNTHLAVGTIVTGLAASVCYTAQVSSLSFSLALWGLGTWGSLLPDIDSDNSVVLKLLFNGLSVMAIALTALWLAPKLPLVGLWAALAGVYLLIRYPIMMLFKEFSRHRGVFHSLLAVAFFFAFTAFCAYRFMEKPAGISWLAGAFVGLGYLVHLILDECFSVDLANSALKKSFGTALKPFSLQYPGRSLVMAAAVAGCVWFGPPIQQSWQTIAGKFHLYMNEA